MQRYPFPSHFDSFLCLSSDPPCPSSTVSLREISPSAQAVTSKIGPFLDHAASPPSSIVRRRPPYGQYRGRSDGRVLRSGQCEPQGQHAILSREDARSHLPSALSPPDTASMLSRGVLYEVNSACCVAMMMPSCLYPHNTLMRLGDAK